MISIGNDEFVPVGPIKIVNKYGKPAKVDGVPTWASDDTSIADVRNVSADGMSAEVWSVDGANGACQITVTADADLGDGTRPLIGTLTVEVADESATGIEIATGSALPKNPGGDV